MTSKSGITLLELLVVLAILGLTAGLALMALPPLRHGSDDAAAARFDSARMTSIQEGRPVAVTIDSALIRLLPDGRALGTGVDPLTGELLRADTTR